MSPFFKKRGKIYIVKAEGGYEMKNLKNIVNFFFELMYLKRIPRSGFMVVGIREPDSVAEHSFVAAQIAYILAKMENVDAEHAAIIALFHDNSETRLGDLNLIQQQYLDKEQAEKKAFLEQTRGLTQSEELMAVFEEFKEGNTPEGIIARDAERLELVIQIKCYLDTGVSNKAFQNWIGRVRAQLRTDSAKELLDVIENTHMNDWWQAIKGVREEIRRLKKELKRK